MRTCLVLCLLCLGVGGALGQEVIILEEGDTFHFFKGLTAPPADWATEDLDPVAAGWESGPTGIGYADEDDATELLDMLGAYLSVYIRTEVTVPPGVEGYVWILRVRYDDAFVAYVDGVEVARRGISGTPPAHDQPAEVDHEIRAPVGFDEEIVLENPGTLSPGTHVFAVQVHNTSLESSDLSFACLLAGIPFAATAVEPPSGPLGGGNTVTVRGLGFDPADQLTVRFGGVLATDVVVQDSERISVRVPPASVPGPVDVEIQDSRGSSVVAGGYRYIDASLVGISFTRERRASAARIGNVTSTGTFEAWVSRGAVGGFQRTRNILAAGTEAGGDAFRLELVGSRPRLRSFEGETALDLAAPLTLAQDTWYHLAVTFSPSGRKLYVDGILAGQDERVIELPSGASLRLGDSFSSVLGFTGIIESVRVWSVERSAEEVRRYRHARIDAEDSLEAFWPMTEGVGQTSADVVQVGAAEIVLGGEAAPDDADPTWTALTGFPSLAIADVDPPTGPLQGGNIVHIYGGGFPDTPAPVVLFGPVAAAAVTVVAPYDLRVEVPAGVDFGVVDVTVQVGAALAVAPGAYGYEPENLRKVVREGDQWHYFVGFSAPPTNWTAPSFDPGAAGWPVGPTGIGYGDDDDATDVSEMLGAAAAVFARIEWELDAEPQEVSFLRLRVRYDDGYVAYLNGSEVARANVAGVPPAFDELASDLHEIAGGAGTFDEEIDLLATARTLLVKGRNVLAIQVHNTTLDSSDLSLSAEILAASGDLPPQVPFIRGDVNMDGLLNITDPILILRWLMLGDVITCLEAADADDDGRINIVDPAFLLVYLFRDGGQPPAPFPEPGTHVDDDPFGCDG